MKLEVMVPTPNFCHKLLRLYHQLQHKEIHVLYLKKKQNLIRARNIQTEYDPTKKYQEAWKNEE